MRKGAFVNDEHLCDCESCEEASGEHDDYCPSCLDCKANDEAELDNEFSFKSGQGIY